jgi:DHA1 family multidrug resistance protein-like MFS transporter
MVALCSPIWGMVADRFGAKPMVCRAVFGGGAVFVLIGFAGRVQVLLALFLLLGCFTGVNTAIVTLVSSLAPRDRLGTAIAACQTGVFIGVSIGPTVGGFLADTFSYRVGIWSGAALLLTAGTIVLIGITEPPRALRQPVRRRSLAQGFRVAGLSRSLLMLIGLIFLVQFSLTMISPVLAVYVRHLSPDATRVATVVGLLLGVEGITSAFGAIFCSRAADRVGQRLVLAWATGIGTLLLASQALARSVPMLLGLRGLSGFFNGGLSAGTNATIGKQVPAGSRGAAFGVAGSAFSLGNAFGPLLGGLVAEAAGPRAVLGLSALVLGCGWLMVQALGRVPEMALVEQPEG